MKQYLAITFIGIVICMATACNNQVPIKIQSLEERYLALNDSAVNLLQVGMMHKDSMALVQALSFTDSILSFDTITAHRYKTYCTRSSIYLVMGEEDKAFEAQERAVSFLPPDHVESLTFYGRKMERMGEPDSARLYYSKAWEVCEKGLIGKDDNNLFAMKIQLLHLLGQDEIAEECLNQQLEANPDDEFLKALKEWGHENTY